MGGDRPPPRPADPGESGENRPLGPGAGGQGLPHLRPRPGNAALPLHPCPVRCGQAPAAAAQRRGGVASVEGGAASGRGGPPPQGLHPLLRLRGGAGRRDPAEKPGTPPPPGTLLRPDVQRDLPSLRPGSPGGPGPPAGEVGHPASGGIQNGRPFGGGGPVPPSVETVL